jgi:hypothetical protein
MNILVKARQKGFYGAVLRYPGDVFPLAPGAKPGKWMEVVDESVEQVKPAKSKPKKDAEPETFSEMAKVDGKAQGHKNGNAA